MITEEIRKRTLRTWHGLQTWCMDCAVHAAMYQMPCMHHCIGAEKKELDQLVNDTIRGLAYVRSHPLLEMLRRDR